MPPKKTRKKTRKRSAEKNTAQSAQKVAKMSSSVVISDVKTGYDGTRVHYHIKLSSKCACGSYKIQTAVPYETLEDNEDAPKVMMEKAIEAIRNHQQKNKNHDGTSKCNLDLSSFATFLSEQWTWRLLWVDAEQHVKQHEEAAKQRSEHQKKQHKRKADAITEKEWEEGDDFKNATAKSEALKATMNTIEQRTGKSVARVRQLMTSISTKLNRSIDGFDSEFVFDRSKQTDAMKVMFARAKSCLESITTCVVALNGVIEVV